jgi:hypothetical protein
MSLAKTIKAAVLNGNLGIKVIRPAQNDVAGWVSIFTIVGGFIQITGLYGIVSTVHVGAANLQFRHSAGGVMCLATACAAATQGTIVTITGIPGENVVIGIGTALNTAPPIQGGMKGSGGGVQQMGVVCGVGTIDVDWTAVTSGQTRYVMTYIPIDDVAHVYAV